MATVTKTFHFAADAESFVANAGANSTLSWDGTTGNPAGALKARILGRNKNNANSWVWTGTWEQLGVPAGSTVTAVRVDSAYTRCTEYVTGASSTIGPYQLQDGSGTLLATLWTGRTITGTDGAWVAVAAQADQSVPSGSQASGSTVKIVLADTLATGANNSAAVSTYDDEVVLVITYSPASGGSSSYPLLNDAETGSSGTAVTTGNSGGANEDAFSAVTVGANMTLAYDSAQAAHGSKAFKVALSSTATAITFVSWTLDAARGRVYGAFHVYLTAFPASSIRIAHFKLGSTLAVGLYVASGTGRIGIRSAADSSLIEGTVSVTRNGWNRIEFDVNVAGGAADAWLYTTADGTTAADHVAVTGQSFGASTVDTVQFGANTANFSSTSGDAFWLDDLNVNLTGVPGPGPYTKSAGGGGGSASGSPGTLAVSAAGAVASGASAAAAALPTLAVTAPQAAGTVSVAAFGATGSLTLSPPAVTASGAAAAAGAPPALTLAAAQVAAAGSATATGTPGTLTLTVAAGSASSGTIAAGSIPQLALTAPAATAAGGAAASAATGTLTLQPPTAAESGDAATVAAIPTLTLTAPAATARGAAAAAGSPGGLTVTAPQASATGAASASGALPSLALTAPAGSASAGTGPAFASGGIPTLTLTTPAAAASVNAAAAGSAPTLTLTAAAAAATGYATAAGGIPQLALSPPAATVTASAVIAGTVGTLTISPATGAARFVPADVSADTTITDQHHTTVSAASTASVSVTATNTETTVVTATDTTTMEVR